MIQGILYIISAPSGAGKSSLVRALLKTQPIYDTQVSISYTTRPKRQGEIHGKHYYFISVIEFKKMIIKNLFLEYDKIFNNYYGTLRSSVEQILKTGVDVLLDINWYGAKQIRNLMKNTLSIFIFPPSKEELSRRLRGRGGEKEEIIVKRTTQAVDDMNHFLEYNYLIINNDFNTALLDLKSIIRSTRLCINRQKIRHNTLIDELLLD